jgi:hypothetical protein
VSSHGAILIIVPTLVFEKVFIFSIYLHICLCCNHKHLALTCGLVNISYRYSTALCFHEHCQLVVIISCVWAVTILLCFCGAIGGSTLFTLRNPCIMELPRCLIICVDMGVPFFGCTVHVNPLVHFISGLRSCENQPP